jgi:hypothetical protein
LSYQKLVRPLFSRSNQIKSLFSLTLHTCLLCVALRLRIFIDTYILQQILNWGTLNLLGVSGSVSTERLYGFFFRDCHRRRYQIHGAVHRRLEPKLRTSLLLEHPYNRLSMVCRVRDRPNSDSYPEIPPE